MIASATEVKVNEILGLFRLFIGLKAIKAQLRSSPGLISVHYRGLRAHSLWENMEAMQAFRNSGAHLQAMRDGARIGKARSVTREVSARPAWREVIGRLKTKSFYI